jgi:2-haloacid dehalogenase
LQPAFTLSAEEAGWYKPRPEIYVAACRRLGESPADVRYVAGTAYDAAGAAAVGLDAFLVARRPDSHGVPAGISIARTMGEALSGFAPRP